jgi:hypothetical protein
LVFFFGAAWTTTWRVNVAPFMPLGDWLVSCRTFEDVFARSDLKTCIGRTKRTSLFPPRNALAPRFVDPSVAFSLPSPLEKTTNRSSRVFAETRSTSGA